MKKFKLLLRLLVLLTLVNLSLPETLTAQSPILPPLTVGKLWVRGITTFDSTAYIKSNATFDSVANPAAPGTNQSQMFMGTGDAPYWRYPNGTYRNLDSTGNAAPGGANTNVQYNNSGAFGGDADFTFNSATDMLASKFTTFNKYLTDVDSTPAQITSNQNNYATGAASVLRLSTNASKNITGLAGGVNGRILTILNVGTQDMVLVNESASSTAANRIITGFGQNLTLSGAQNIQLWYDGTQSRWVIMSNTSGVTATGSAGLGSTFSGNKLRFTTRTGTALASGFGFNVQPTDSIILEIDDASATERGFSNTSDQTYAGTKRFNSFIVPGGGVVFPNTITSGAGPFTMSAGGGFKTIHTNDMTFNILEATGADANGTISTMFFKSSLSYSRDSATVHITGGYNWGLMGPSADLKLRRHGDWVQVLTTSITGINSGYPLNGLYHGEFFPAQLPISSNQLSTTDGSVDTIGTIEIPVDWSGLIEVTISGRQTGAGDGNSALYRFTNHYESNGSVGSLVAANVGLDDITSEQDATWAASLVLFGNKVYVTVTGTAATTIKWAYWAKIRGVTE